MQRLKFAENLRNILNAHKMTQKELAERLNTTQQTISRWLKAVNEPDLETLLQLCLYLDETPNSILGYDEITEQEKAELKRR